MKTTKTLLFASMLCGFTAAHAQDNVVTATYGNATGNTQRTMTVALNHEKDYVAFHLVMDIPAGTTVKDVKAKSPLKNGGTVDLSTKGGTSTESTDFKVPFYQNGATCNIVGYNYGNVKIKQGTTGEVLLTVTLETASGVAYNAKGVKATSCTFVEDGSYTETALNTTTEYSEARLWGDVVKDGKLDAKDKQTLTNILLEKPYDSNTDLFAGDMNQDDKYDAKDKQTLSNKILAK